MFTTSGIGVADAGLFDDSALPACDWQIAARYLDPTTAHIVCGCLKAAGIPAAVADDQLNQANSLWTPALGGVRILVPVPHLEEAARVVAAFERGEFTLPDDQDVA
jgi:hypothetical protein